MKRWLAKVAEAMLTDGSPPMWRPEANWGWGPEEKPKGGDRGCFVVRGVRTVIVWYLSPI